LEKKGKVSRKKLKGGHPFEKKVEERSIKDSDGSRSEGSKENQKKRQ